MVEEINIPEETHLGKVFPTHAAFGERLVDELSPSGGGLSGNPALYLPLANTGRSVSSGHREASEG